MKPQKGKHKEGKLQVNFVNTDAKLFSEILTNGIQQCVIGKNTLWPGWIYPKKLKVGLTLENHFMLFTTLV